MSRAQREAELEALREKQIAGQQAKSLNASASQPLGLDDWQAQQRALKQAEREKKEAAAKGLLNYKVGYDPNALSALKAEDSKKRREAKQQLHAYRPDSKSNLFGNKKEQQGSKQYKDWTQQSGGSTPAQESEGKAEEVPPAAPSMDIPSVGSLAVNTGIPSLDDSSPATTSTQNLTDAAEASTSSKPPLPKPIDDSNRNSSVGLQHLPTIVASPRESSTGLQPQQIAADEKDGFLCVAPPPTIDEAPVLIETPSSEDDDEAAVMISAHPPLSESPELVESPTAARVASTATKSTHEAKEETILEAGVTNASAPAADWVSVNQPTPVTPMPEPVSFSFALLSSDFAPNVDKYMLATQQILQTPDRAVVQDMEEDRSYYGGSCTTKRYLVKAIVMSLSDAPSVLQMLRNAVSDGSFLVNANQAASAL